jgi:transposase
MVRLRAWLPEAWIAPPELRELRELVRYRAKLVALRSGLKAQVHAVLAKEGVHVPMTDLFGVAGNRLLDSLELAPAFELRVRSLRDLISVYDTQVVAFERALTERLAGHRGYRAIQAIHGVGRVFAALFVAEIGDVTRFPGPRQLCSWAGLTPKHHESDTVVRRGSITKQGSWVVRWAAVEAVTQARGHVQDPSGPSAHRGAAWHRHRQGCRGPQTSHARLLRPARRRDPLSHQAPGRVRRLGPQEHASSTSAMVPTRRGRALD